MGRLRWVGRVDLVGPVVVQWGGWGVGRVDWAGWGRVSSVIELSRPCSKSCAYLEIFAQQADRVARTRRNILFVRRYPSGPVN